MTRDAAEHGPYADALLAAQLMLLAPRQLRGMVLRGSGPARDQLLTAMRSRSDTWRRLPPHIDDERLLGGIDLAASLAAGKPVIEAGLLAEAEGGVVCVPMAERMRESLAGRLVQAIDDAGGEQGFALVLLDDGKEPDERAPGNLADRVAFACDLAEVRPAEHADIPSASMQLSETDMLSDDQFSGLVSAAMALGVGSARALVYACHAARAHAALQGRGNVTDEDLAVAARLVLAPRATQLPAVGEDEAPPHAPDDDSAPDEHSDTDADRDTLREGELEDLILEAALASIPRDILEAIAQGRMRAGATGGMRGKRTQSKLRGRPLGARPGVPRGGARLALIDSLRAAAPWQTVRRRDEPEAERAVLVRKDDLRVRRFEECSQTVTIFCVDASGSAAASRLAEAKGAVELILAQAYVKRSEVALIAFRGDSAEVLLPQTRSLTRARRALAGLPGGGGTPLASGILASVQMGEAIAARGATPFLVFLTDGSANIALDGTPGRPQARADAESAAKRLAAARLDALLIDIAPRPRPDAEKLAGLMRARYLPLPKADAAALERAVRSAQPEPA